MNIEDAVAALDGLTNEEAAPEETVETQADGAQISDAGDPPEEDEVEGAGDGQPDDEAVEGDEGEPELPAIDPPKFWDADDKAAFANLPRSEQERIAKYAAKGDAATSKAIQEAAQSRKAAESIQAELSAKRDELSSVVEQAAHKFVRTWEGVDWPAWYQQDFQQATVARAQFEQEQKLMQDLVFKKQEADKHATISYLKSEAQALFKLAEADPVVAELLDAKEGQARRTEVADYLVTNGIPADRLQFISATEMSMARKAMLYDKAQAEIKDKAGKPAPSSTKQPTSQGNRAPQMRSGARPSTSPQSATVKAASERLARSGSIEDAVGLLDLRDKNQRKK